MLVMGGNAPPNWLPQDRAACKTWQGKEIGVQSALAPWAPGNALCARCHGEHPDRRFPGLVAKLYDTPEHHFHPAVPYYHLRAVSDLYGDAPDAFEIHASYFDVLRRCRADRA